MRNWNSCWPYWSHWPCWLFPPCWPFLLYWPPVDHAPLIIISSCWKLSQKVMIVIWDKHTTSQSGLESDCKQERNLCHVIVLNQPFTIDLELNLRIFCIAKKSNMFNFLETWISEYGVVGFVERFVPSVDFFKMNCCWPFLSFSEKTNCMNVVSVSPTASCRS